MTDKRRDIISQAACLIHAKGYENTKLSDILEAACIGKGNFYHYFSSKHDLGLAVLDYIFNYWNRSLLEGVLSSTKDPKIKLNEMFEWMINLQRKNEAKHGCVFGNLALEMSEHDEEFRLRVKTVFDTWEEKLQQVFREIMVGYEVSEDEIKRLSQSVVALLEGGTMLMKNKQDINVLINIVEMAKTMIDSFVQQKTIRYEQ